MEKRNCKKCNREFLHRAAPSDLAVANGKYCSDVCRIEGQRKLPTEFVCKQCGGSMPNLYGKVRMFCSYACKSAAQIGKPSPTKGIPASLEARIKNSITRRQQVANGWKANTSGLRPGWGKGKGVGRKLVDQIRDMPEMVDWRNIVLSRDSWRCVECGAGERIHAHHLWQLHLLVAQHGVTSVEEAKGCAALWDTENGMTLCRQCHRAAHSKYFEVDRAMKELVREGRAEKKVENIKGREVVFYRAV